MVRSLKIALAALVFGVFAGPLLGCLVTAISPAQSPVLEPDFTPETKEAIGLFDAYRTAFPDLEEIALDPEVTRLSPEACGYRAGQIDVGNDPAISALSGGVMSIHENRLIMAAETTRRSTGFGRRFLTACLQTPIYRELCEPAAFQILAPGSERSLRGDANFAARYRRATCTYYDGLYARQRRLPALPDRPVSTP